MVKLSQKTMVLLKNDLMAILYENQLRPLFTNQIATELRRDNEFTKRLLLKLKKEGLVQEIRKNKRGQTYLSHIKWGIPSQVIKRISIE